MRVGAGLSLLSAAVMAVNDRPAPPVGSPDENVWMPESPLFTPFTGTVLVITERLPGFKYVYVENDGGEPAYLIVSGDTFFVNDHEMVKP